MKNKYLLWMALLITATLTALLYYPFIVNTATASKGSSKNIGVDYISDTINTTYETPSDSLPEYKYRELIKPIEDSIKSEKENREYENDGKGFEGSLFPSMGGVVSYKDKDEEEERRKIADTMGKTIFHYFDLMDKTENKDSIVYFRKIIDSIQLSINILLNKPYIKRKYFIAISSYVLPTKDYFADTTFVVSNRKFYIKYAHIDSIVNNRKEGHYVYKEVPLRYIKDSKSLLIPTTKLYYNLVIGLIMVVGLITSSGFLYFIILLPIKCLLRIARGNPFDVENIAALFSISYSLFAYSAIVIGLPFIFRLMFCKIIPPEFSLVKGEGLSNNWMFILAGIIVFLIAKAFRKGYQLQNEQDLTI